MLLASLLGFPQCQAIDSAALAVLSVRHHHAKRQVLGKKKGHTTAGAAEALGRPPPPSRALRVRPHRCLCPQLEAKGLSPAAHPEHLPKASLRAEPW